MKDLFLTPRGDLAIEDMSDSKQRLEINFITSKSNALRLNFFIEDTFSKTKSENSLLLNFKVDVPENNKELRLISGNLAIEQAIKIRLLSSLGSIQGNKDIGSKIETVIHSFIDKDATLITLEKLIKEAISDIVSNPVIKISKLNSKYTDYSDTLKITLIDNKNNYNIEL